MPTIQTIARPRRNRVTVSVPEEYKGYSFQVILVPFKEEKKAAYDFSDLAGKLRWKGDPVKIQRRMRDAW